MSGRDEYWAHGLQEYILPRNSSELVRLTTQHYLASMRIGFLLHPVIADHISLLEKPRIADVACGSALWATHVAERYPTCFVDALDISDNFFPRPELRQQHNVSYDTLDLLQAEDVSRFAGLFDVVHIRYLLSAAPLSKPEIWIRNIKALLKPGGYLQWEDAAGLILPMVNFDVSNTANELFTTKEGRKYELKQPQTFSSIVKFTGIAEKTAWFENFHKIAAEVGGLEELEKHDLRPPVIPHLLQMETHSGQGAFFTAIRTYNRNKHPQLHAFEEDYKQMNQAIEKGQLTSYNIFVKIARKASDPEMQMGTS